MELKKLVRTAQTYAGPFVEVKGYMQSNLRKLFRKPSEPSYHGFKNFPFQKGLQVLDVGANRGQTIASLRLFQPSVPIVAFEPNPILAARLRRQFKSDRNLTVHSFGLGADSGFFDLYIPYYRGFMFDGLASFDWASAHDWLNEERIYRFDRKHLTVERVRCEVRRLDDMATCPTLVKIDVQGSESAVLIGGLRTIRQHRPAFLIENDAERKHEQILFPEGYRRAAYTDGRLKLDEVGPGDTYYIPEEQWKQIPAAYGD